MEETPRVVPYGYCALLVQYSVLLYYNNIMVSYCNAFLIFFKRRADCDHPMVKLDTRRPIQFVS